MVTHMPVLGDGYGEAMRKKQSGPAILFGLEKYGEPLTS